MVVAPLFHWQLVPLRYRLVNVRDILPGLFAENALAGKLAVLYPLPHHLLRTQFFAATVFLIVVSCWVWQTRHTRPYLLVGWLWFLGTLVPVIGLVQVGGAALADRYTYLPSIGLFLAVAFGFRELAARFQLPKSAVAAAAVFILGGCLLATEHQLRFWRDSEALFRHALAVTRNNDIAHVNLGVALEQQGRYAEALAEYREAAKLAPGRYQTHNNLGNLLDKMGRPDEALAEYREAVRLKPEPGISAQQPRRRARRAGKIRRGAEGICRSGAARCRIIPGPISRLGKVLLKQGRDAEADGRIPRRAAD